ncbi:MAG: hypothetical protein M1827_002312 [Pycnora praestabilis]|nr:MAG: hypothetical protein M1827_002312 [Pycnora praestabilis]
MPTATDAPKQFKQPSRKGKKAWRKNVDITEVQQGLENVRAEVIQGGVISEKPSDDLFTLDTAGSTSIQKTYKTNKPLKADEILAQRSAVPAIESRKRSGLDITDGVIEPSSKRRRGGGVSHKELTRLKQIAYGGEGVHKDIIQAEIVPDYDPWAGGGEDYGNQDPMFSFLEPPKQVKEPRTLKHAPISLLANGKQIAAVRAPEAGKSYNPSFQDWDELLTKEGIREVDAEKKRLRDAEVEQERLERAAASAREQENEVTSDEQSAWEGFESEMEGDEWLARKRPERKTPAQRNKVKKRKEAERKALQDAQMRKRNRQAEEIRNLARAVEEKEASRFAIMSTGKNGELIGNDDRKLRRRKLGKAMLPEPTLELVLPDELQDSLRLLKPEGNLLKDRFRSLLIRGKMETRRPVSQAKKAKRTLTEKWTYKDFKIQP